MKVLIALLISFSFLPAYSSDANNVFEESSFKKKYINLTKKQRRKLNKKKTNFGDKVEFIVDFGPGNTEHDHSMTGVVFHDEEDGHFELIDKDSIVVSRRNKNSKSKLVGATAAEAKGNLKTLVIALADRVANADSKLYSRSFLTRSYFDDVEPSLNTYYKEASSDRVSFSGLVHDRLFIFRNLCTEGNIFETGAVSELLGIIDQEVDLSPYDRLSFVFPEDNFCLGGALGVATLGSLEFKNSFGKETKIAISYNISAGANFNNSTYFLKVITHEFGHNFGLQHDNASSCGDSIFQADCDSLEYGGVHSIMGFSPNLAHPNAIHQMDLKWLTSDQVQLVDQDNTQIEVTLQALALDTDTGIKAIKIERADGTFYTVEYRSPFGMENLSYAVQNLSYGGLQIYYNNDGNVNINGRSDSALLNNNLQSFSIKDSSQYTGLLSNTSFSPGNVFYDSVSDIRITPISVTATEARVLVEKRFIPGDDGGITTTEVDAPYVHQGIELNLNAKGVTKEKVVLVYNGDALTNGKIIIKVPKAYRKFIKIKKKSFAMTDNLANVKMKFAGPKKFENKMGVNEDGQYSVDLKVKVVDKDTKTVVYQGISRIYINPSDL